MPVIPIIAAVSGVLGAVSSMKGQGAQNKALSIQEQIAQQEQTDKQKVFEQLVPFFTKYLGAGSPFLQNIQSQAAGENAQQTNDAAGTFREEMSQRGTGYGPSGATAAGLAGIGAESAKTGSTNYLQNLLNNEQIKFQAAHGLQGAGEMAGASQNQPNVGVNLPAQSGAAGIGALGDILKSLLKGTSRSTSTVGSLPTKSGVPNMPPIPQLPGPAPTSGWAI